MKRNTLAIGVIIIAALVIAWAFYSDPLGNNTRVDEQLPEISFNETITGVAPPAVTKKAEVKKVELSPEIVFIDQTVPFTSQAPTGDWEDQRQQDGCEEASALMAVYWARGERLDSNVALREILAISDYEQEKYGEYRDIAVDDVVKWIFKDYFKHDKALVKRDATIDDIIAELQKGNIILMPADGQKLGNPYFTAPGPERHMLVIRGYDPVAKEFITNDPGTRRGKAYRYNEYTLYNAIMAYSTGYHVPVIGMPKHIIVVSK